VAQSVSNNHKFQQNDTKPGSIVRQALPTGLFVVWVLLMVLPPYALWTLRGSWLADLDSPNIQAEWNEFRNDMQKQSDMSGPVQHKVPKSAEPPLRVWLRDYFWLAVVAWAVLASVLFGFFGIAVLGVTK
jgi:hypothetical protein|tara:strand:- start:368 stop:757 length:390 start_codon:yes stop_codon:yes gene_type:complete